MLLACLVALGTLTIGSAAAGAERREAPTSDRDFAALAGAATARAATVLTVVPPSPRTATSPRPPIADPVRPATTESRPAAGPGPANRARLGIETPARAIVGGVPRPVAVFLGDSYVTGWQGVGEGADGWPARVTRALGWRARVRAEAGTGFVNPGWTGEPIRTKLAEAIRLRPGVIVVAGGHNDRRYGSERAGLAADRVLDRLRTGVPDALIVVIGPIWQDASPPASILALRDHLRRKAKAIGALFIDPIRDGWFSGRNHRFIGSDGIHPTDAGHRHIATLVLARLRADPRLGD